ncbi:MULTISPECIES: DUF4129 domain-containing protein [Pseudomonas]|uniref:Membrane protein n=2 Tax=Pseudomonadaceae TaxID=135621 RepID=A0A0D0ICA4_9PSED|nr:MULTISPECIES: DUF4129 domain-containing protein [Pseudomonas]KIP90487.1 membrane protein [Pseudomonas fulva]MCW2290974.1 hypothetical protein [Pseudomonas sp. BIGb0408]NYH74455.1 hypothetical protein [Pseudomonas flavescens]
MRLTDASVAIRPRTPWEAIDLGVLMAGRHRSLLMASWAAVTVPIFALLCALLWQYPTWAILVFWWLKPAYERLPLYILSRALFGDTPTFKQALKAFPGLLKPQLLASLTWRRLSPSRSFDLPVLQLEGLKGKERTQRLNVLAQRDAGAATWLTVVGIHLETALWVGLGSLVYLLIPTQVSTEWDWQSLINGDTSDWFWLEHLSNLAYVLLLILWEPIYVACGFSLYLNRRTALEGWDIELTFRRLRQRLTGVAYALLLGCGMLLLNVPTPALADTSHSCPLPSEDPDGPQAPRMLAQPLSTEASRESVLAILDETPFENREAVTRWRFGDEAKQEEPSEDSRKALESLFEMLESWTALKGIALFFEAVLWALLIGIVALVLWRYREWLSTFAGGTRLRMPQRSQSPDQLFGLEVLPQSLPDDVASTAERLWQDDPRAALGLLYRALLSRLIHDHKLPLKGSHTEAEVLPLVDGLDDPELSNFSQTLTRHWQNLAYGHRLPPTEARPALCNDWRRLIEHGGRS